MRRRSSLSYLLPLLTLPIAVVGCGGSDDGNDRPSTGTPTANTASTGIDIAWAGRSRAIEAPSSALSARVTFVGGSSTGTDVTFVVNRRADPAAYVSTYGAPTPVKTGGVSIRVQFYAAANAGGAVVALAETSAILKTDGTLSRADGSSLGSVSSVGTIDAITLNAPATLAVGATAQLTVTARDANGNVVAISPGSATFSRGSANLSLTPEGVVTGGTPGEAFVSASVDGRSANATITVVRAPNGAIVEISQPVNSLVYSASQNRVFATTPGAGANANRLIGLIPTTGAVDQSIAIGSNPGPIGLSANGNVAYVGLLGSGTVRRVDLTTNTVGTPISLGTEIGGSFGSTGQRFPSDLAVSPIDSNTFVVSTFTGTNDAQRRLILFQNGVAKPTTVSGFYLNAVVTFGTDGANVYGYNNQISSFDVTRNAVSANGVTQSQTASNVFSNFSSRIAEANGRLYGGDGRVVNAQTFARIGQFTLPGQNATAFDIDTTARRIYFLLTPFGSGDAQIAIYDIDTFAQVDTVALPGVSTTGNGPSQIVLAGTNRVAIATADDKVYFVDLSKL